MTRTKEVVELVERVRPLFAGKHPIVQAGALAELVTTWLAGHTDNTPQSTRRVRHILLEQFAEAVRDLLKVA